MITTYYEGQRLSLRKQLLTVHYIGPVSGKSGEWLGVEWDDPQRGKHDGTHEGKQYFLPRRSHATSCSFLRPNQPWDDSRTFVQALREKYISANERHADTIVYVSGKQAEEVGFEKFAQRQRELRGIRVLVLDGMNIKHRSVDDDVSEIADLCGEITDLNIGRNLFETLSEVHDICRRLPKLKTLNLDGNRFRTEALDGTFSTITELSLGDTLLHWDELLGLRAIFPILQSLACPQEFWQPDGNCITLDFPATLRRFDISDNLMTSLAELHQICETSNLTTINLKRNKITTVGKEAFQVPSLCRQEDLDLNYNAITTFPFFDDLYTTFPLLKHLRVTGNPLYTTSKNPQGKPLTPEEGYMQTIARIPTLETLNYSKITPKERLNSETYYLNQIALALSLSPPTSHPTILKAHARWSALCDEYGEPTITPQTATDSKGYPSNSLGTRLIAITFSITHLTITETWRREIPKTFSIYRVLGLVGKKISISPLKVRLVWETGERDPKGVERVGEYVAAAEWWDSDDEEQDGGGSGEDLVEREVELVAGTRGLGTYIEGDEGRVRVEIRE